MVLFRNKKKNYLLFKLTKIPPRYFNPILSSPTRSLYLSDSLSLLLQAAAVAAPALRGKALAAAEIGWSALVPARRRAAAAACKGRAAAADAHGFEGGGGRCAQLRGRRWHLRTTLTVATMVLVGWERRWLCAEGGRQWRLWRVKGGRWWFA